MRGISLIPIGLIRGRYNDQRDAELPFFQRVTGSPAPTPSNDACGWQCASRRGRCRSLSRSARHLGGRDPRSYTRPASTERLTLLSRRAVLGIGSGKAADSYLRRSNDPAIPALPGKTLYQLGLMYRSRTQTRQAVRPPASPVARYPEAIVRQAGQRLDGRSTYGLAQSPPDC